MLPIVDALRAAGNEPIYEGFHPTQGGWDCEMRLPLDLEKVKPLIAVNEQAVHLRLGPDEVLCRHCWASVLGPGAWAIVQSDRWQGACPACRNVGTLYGSLIRLAHDETRHSLLLRCPRCATLYDLYPEERTPPERLEESEARSRYPGAL